MSSEQEPPLRSLRNVTCALAEGEFGITLDHRLTCWPRRMLDLCRRIDSPQKHNRGHSLECVPPPRHAHVVTVTGQLADTPSRGLVNSRMSPLTFCSLFFSSSADSSTLREQDRGAKYTQQTKIRFIERLVVFKIPKNLQPYNCCRRRHRRRRRRSEMTSAGECLYARILYSKIKYKKIKQY